MVDITAHYKSLHAATNAVLAEILASTDLQSALSKSHNYIVDYDLMGEMVSQKPESHLMFLAINEYQHALLAIAEGRNRHAFSGLRLFFELYLASFYFSAHEVFYHMWSNRDWDLRWQVINDEEKGIFSNDFVKAFNPSLTAHRKTHQSLSSQSRMPFCVRSKPHKHRF